jgi:hypothetical protein
VLAANRGFCFVVLAALAAVGCGAGAKNTRPAALEDVLDRDFVFAIDGLRGPGGIL